MIGTLLRIRYELVQELEDGPLFLVFRARDRMVGRDVTIRLLQPPFNQERPFVEALEPVVRQIASLPHPNIERMLEVDEHEGAPFLLCEFSAGQTLDERIRKLAPFSVQASLVLAIELVNALAALHEAKIVHGDVSGRTIRATADNHVRLMLSGLWKSYSHSRTAGSVVLPAMAPYLAPEITQGSMPSAESDIYATGVLMYELLAGQHPFAAETPMAMAMKHATSPIPSIRSVNPAVPQVLEMVIMKALSKHPGERYPEARALLKDLRLLQDALRFGRQVSWPLDPTEDRPKGPALPAEYHSLGSAPVESEEPRSDAAEEPVPTVSVPIRTEDEVPTRPRWQQQAAQAEESGNVAPAMSALKERPKTTKARPAPEIGDGVPKFLLALGYIAALALVVMVSAFTFWSITKPRQITVPNLVGLSTADARDRLAKIKLTLKVQRREANEKKPENEILETNPPSGRAVREGSIVYSVVSSGTRFVEVPDLRGRTVEEAREVAAKFDLEIADPVVRRRSREIPKGMIVSQIPEPNMKLERNARIRVAVSAGDVRVNDVASSKTYEYKLKINLPADLPSVVLRVDMTDDTGTRTVYERRNRGGDPIEIAEQGRGTEATFRIFYNGQMATQVTKQAQGLDEEPQQ